MVKSLRKDCFLLPEKESPCRGCFLLPICINKTCFQIVRECTIALDHMIKDSAVEIGDTGSIGIYYDSTLKKSFSLYYSELNLKVYISEVNAVKINEDGSAWIENCKIGKQWLVLDVAKEE